MKVIILFLAGLAACFSGMYGADMRPAPIVNAEIVDHEYDVYDLVQGGVTIGYRYLWYEYDATNKNIILMRQADCPFGSTNKYKEYRITLTNGRITGGLPLTWWIDKSRGTVLREFADQLDFAKKYNIKGNATIDLNVNGTEETKVVKSWDGYSVHEDKSRTRNLDNNYSFWDDASFTYIGCRLTDYTQKGRFYMLPVIFKDPFLGGILKIREEKVKTPMGEINCDVLQYGGDDDFLLALMKPYVTSFFFYVEKGPKRRLIKFVDKMFNVTMLIRESGVLR